MYKKLVKFSNRKESKNRRPVCCAIQAAQKLSPDRRPVGQNDKTAYTVIDFRTSIRVGHDRRVIDTMHPKFINGLNFSSESGSGITRTPERPISGPKTPRTCIFLCTSPSLRREIAAKCYKCSILRSKNAAKMRIFDELENPQAKLALRKDFSKNCIAYTVLALEPSPEQFFET